MLVGLHVKNLALIEQADVEFGNGLNILTGETGAGKSIIIGSVALAILKRGPIHFTNVSGPLFIPKISRLN